MDLNSVELPLLFEDKRFINQVLVGQPEWIWQAAMRDYKAAWIEAANSAPCEIKRDNIGRRAANTFLRETIWPSLSENTNSAA